MFNLKKFILPLSFLLFCSQAYSLPIDWHGAFGVDSVLYDNYRMIDNRADNSASTVGTQEAQLAGGGHSNASWQSYIFRLNPVMIVNDSASLKGEITTGYGRGGRLGDDPNIGADDGLGNALYYYNTSISNTMNLNKFYLELYADTATYLIGRHSAHWGLGAIVNSGEELWDRHSSSRDGVTVKLKLGNFFISPFYSKVATGSSFTRATNAKEYGFSLLYDSVEKDMAFGIYYSVKKSNWVNNTFNTDIDPSSPSQNLGRTDLKTTDIYFKKGLGKFNFELEVPLLSGDLGHIYSATSTTRYKAKAILFETEYEASDAWTFGFDIGKVSGDSGGQSSFEAMYLNPNFQIAGLLFRYNRAAISGKNTTSGSIYDSYVTNVSYLKLRTKFVLNKWHWKAALIWAKAEEVAKTGNASFNHEKNKVFNASANQSDDYGMELDLGFDYHWNEEVKIGGEVDYLFTGDYYSFTDNASANSAKNSYALKINVGVDF